MTTLVPHIGYDKSAELAHKAQQTGQTIMEVALAETDLNKQELQKILDPESMTEPGVSGTSLGYESHKNFLAIRI